MFNLHRNIVDEIGAFNSLSQLLQLLGANLAVRFNLKPPQSAFAQVINLLTEKLELKSSDRFSKNIQRLLIFDLRKIVLRFWT
jgi:hypothetical protein